MTWKQIRLIHLKVKIKSLAEEARIIRKEERKTRDDECRGSLRWHRIDKVRREARYSQVAYAFLRGKRYRSIERKGSLPLSQDRLNKLVRNFGGDYGTDVTSWLQKE